MAVVPPAVPPAAQQTPATSRTPAPFSPEEIARVRAPFRKATLLPGRAYHDEAVYAWEQGEIFLRDWIAIGRAEEVPEPGSFLLRDVDGESVILVRGRDDVVRAFYNVCRYRGTASGAPGSRPACVRHRMVAGATVSALTPHHRTPATPARRSGSPRSRLGCPAR